MVNGRAFVCDGRGAGTRAREVCKKRIRHEQASVKARIREGARMGSMEHRMSKWSREFIGLPRSCVAES